MHYNNVVALALAHTYIPTVLFARYNLTMNISHPCPFAQNNTSRTVVVHQLNVRDANTQPLHTGGVSRVYFKT